MILEYYRQLIAISVILLLFGCSMPFLMVLRIVESTLLLNFLSFAASVLGLFLGLAGIAGARVVEKHKSEREDRYK